MPRKTFRVPNIFGDQDAEIVENALRQTLGVQDVNIQPASKVVAVEWSEPASWDELRDKLGLLGYVTEEYAD